MRSAGFLLLLALVATLGLSALWAGCTYVQKSNREVRLRNQIEAQVQDRDQVYDHGKKVVLQQVDVTQAYADDFGAVYEGLISGRYDAGGGQLMQWVQEADPTLDAGLYRQVQTTIERTRGEVMREQRELLALDQAHKDLREQFPGSLFVGSRPDVEFEIITSSATRAEAASGVEDDTALFDR